jgi:hypothetical protein
MTMTGPSEEDVHRIFGALVSQLHGQRTLTSARAAVLKAGITGVNAPKQYWAPFLDGVEKAFCGLEPANRLTAISILAAEFSEDKGVQGLLAQHGYEFIDGTFVPVGLLDQREARYLPPSSAAELAKAMKRLVDGDATGAITAACGAVETLMQQLYRKHGLGDPANAAYAAKVGTVMKQLGVLDEMKQELVAVGLQSADAEKIITAIGRTTNSAAELLQTVRRIESDVHGSKPALHRTAYDAIKWASAICGLLEGRT